MTGDVPKRMIREYGKHIQSAFFNCAKAKFKQIPL